MPLIKSKSKEAFNANVGTLMREVGSSPHVQSRKQALAIAYDVKRRSKAEGGKVRAPMGYDLPEIRSMPYGRIGRGGELLDPNPRQSKHMINSLEYDRSLARKEGLDVVGSDARLRRLKEGLKDYPRELDNASGGAVRRARRAEGGGIHVGSIASDVPGRTDNHPMDVAAGSYVVPAEAVSNLGENNTAAGLSKLDEVMSGSPEQIRRFFGVKLSLDFARGGAAMNEGVGQPVPINAAGGEFVIPPEAVAIVGSGDVTRGHKLLDAWVMSRRKNHIKTLQRLPRPAKD